VQHVQVLLCVKLVRVDLVYKATNAIPAPLELSWTAKIAKHVQILVIHVPAILYAKPAKVGTHCKALCVVPAQQELISMAKLAKVRESLLINNA